MMEGGEVPRPGRKLVFGCARWPGNKKPPRWAVVCGQWAQALERVHAVFAQGRFLGEQADHFFRRTRLWLWSGFVLFGLELHNGVEESHGFSFRVVEGAAFLSNGLCRSMVDYDCENFVKPMNFYEVIRFAEMCRCACWCSSQTQTPCGQGAWVFPLLSCRGQRRWCGGLCCSWQPGLPHPLTVYALWRLDTAGHCAEHPPCRVTLLSRTNPQRGRGSNIGGAGREWIGKGAGGAGGKGGVRSLQYI